MLKLIAQHAIQKESFLFRKDKFSYYTCIKCGTYYLNPRANYKTLNEFYKNSKLYEFWNNRIFPATEKVRSKKIFKPRVKNITNLQKYKVNRQKIIDIGAGYGLFVQ